MSPNFASLAIGISGSVSQSLVLKATVIVAFGLLVVRLMRGARAARRSLVLAWTFALLAALPVVDAIAPAIPVVVRESSATLSSTPASDHVATPIDAAHSVVTNMPSAAVQPTATGRDTATSIMAAVWATGVIVALIPVLMTVYRLRGLRRTARPWNPGHGRNVRPARILVHDRVDAPMTFGWLRPYVLLPREAETWPADDLERALVHELEHVRRGDWPVHVLARVVCAFYWFHPLGWQAWRQLHLEADRACDDAVAGRGSAQEFANQLVMLAARMTSRTAVPALSMAGGDLVTRVNALLNPNQARGRSGLRFAVAVSVAAVALGATVAALGAVERTTFERPAAQRPAVSTKSQESVDGRPAVPVAPKRRQPKTPARPRSMPSAAPLQGQNQAVAADDKVRVQITATIGERDYVIGIGDVLTVTHWREKGLSGDHMVRPDGKISVPLVNDIQAAGLTPEQLRDSLTKAMAKFLTDPNITVGLRAINSRKVYVVGGVWKPGPYDLVGPTSVMQLLSMAGGLRDFVTGTNIVIIRSENGKQIALRFNYQELRFAQNLAQNILLIPGDSVIVPE